MLRQDSTSCNCLEIPEDASTLLSGFKIDQRNPQDFFSREQVITTFGFTCLFLKCQRCFLQMKQEKINKPVKLQWTALIYDIHEIWEKLVFAAVYRSLVGKKIKMLIYKS